MPGPAYDLVRIVYYNHPPRSRYSGGAKSYRRLNDALRKVLDAAIEGALPFQLTDFEQIYGDFCGGHWFGSPRGERFYGIAVEAGNISACRSIESMLQRKPFIWQKKRLACGSSFLWSGEKITETVWVTSLDDTQIVACAYDGARHRGKVKRRYNITHKQLRAANKSANDDRRRHNSC